MPTFKLNKLVRDKLPVIYKKLGQKITTRELSSAEYIEELKRKLIEEASELPSTSGDEAVKELADLQQVIDDLAAAYKISPETICTAQQKANKEKGGFAGRIYVETIILGEDDPWVEYYRKEPERFEEITDENDA